MIVRLVRYHDAQRAQMWWFVAGVSPLLVGLVTDTGASPVASLVSAVVIFATMLGGMAWALLGTPGRKVATQETRQHGPHLTNGVEGSNHERQCITANGRARPRGSVGGAVVNTPADRGETLRLLDTGATIDVFLAGGDPATPVIVRSSATRWSGLRTIVPRVRRKATAQ